MAGQRDVFGRRFVDVEPMRMRVVDAEKFEATFAELLHQAKDLLGLNFVVPDRISRHVLRRESPRDQSSLARKDSAAFAVRLTASMLQELAVDFASTLDGGDHAESIPSAPLLNCSLKLIRS